MQRLITLDDLQKHPELSQMGVSLNQHFDMELYEKHHTNEIPPVAKIPDIHTVTRPIQKAVTEPKKTLIPEKVEEPKKKNVIPKKVEQVKKKTMIPEKKVKKVATKKPGKKK